MRAITKEAEPASLTRHRCTTIGADYSNYADKDGLREALVREQRGICCYCMSPIQPDPDHMKIEHWHSQKLFPSEQLDYGNLLGSCLGGEGQPKARQHCDTRKWDNIISRNPANPAHQVEATLRYESDGRISSSDPDFDWELNETLNLNVAFLVNNRKAVLDGLKRALEKRGHLQRSTLERLLQDWNGESNSNSLRPYCQIVVYWLRKRLKRV